MAGASWRTGPRPSASGRSSRRWCAPSRPSSSVAAARTILSRIEGRSGSSRDAARARTPSLRKLGLSAAKAAIARARVGRSTAISTGLAELPDDAVRELLAVKGIGPWTVQMALLFALGRADVWPVGDVGIQRAARTLYGVERDGLEHLGERFRPYRSHAAWYLWRSLDG
jgi:DNA-3-methyladenine glycosylase II